MITYPEALSLILSHTYPLPKFRLPLEKSPGYALAQPFFAKHEVPLFDQSAVDGFAVQAVDVSSASEDAPIRLKLAGVIRAGSAARPRVKTGSAVKALTGGHLPPGADAVVMKEVCIEEDGHVVIRWQARQGQNIRWKGEEFRKGDLVLAAGTLITPPVIGLLATFGAGEILVHRKPSVTLVVTGDELAGPGGKLRSGQIRDSNSYALAAALRELGIDNLRVARLGDARKPLLRTLARALTSSDIVITVGGVSVGDYDLVKDVLAELGVETVYWRVAIKPGMPNFFGTFGRGKSPRTLVFGLPGNPVAALVSLQQLVNPSILRLKGCSEREPLRLIALLRGELRKKAGRMEWVRGALSGEGGVLTVRPFAGQGSHMLGGLAQANCLIEFPLEASRLDDGARVTVELLTWRSCPAGSW